MRHLSIYSLVLLSCLATGCKRQSTSTTVAASETYISSAGSVAFDVERKSSGPGAAGEWEASYTSHDKTAHFRIVLEPTATNVQFAGGRGKIVAESKSDATGLLIDLQKALEAKSLPHNISRASDLPFEYSILGENQSQIPGGNGGFNSIPPGSWVLLKVFFGDGEDESEVYLNLNPVLKKGEFSIKDVDYGDAVLSNLAKVL
jgi:hypothetical protein